MFAGSTSNDADTFLLVIRQFLGDANIMKTKLIFILFAALLLNQNAQGSTSTGKVARTYVLAHCATVPAQPPCNTAIVALNVPNNAPPPCATIPAEWAFTLDTAAGKAMFNAILHAQAVGATVTIQGDGSCAAWPDRERPLFITFAYP